MDLDRIYYSQIEVAEEIRKLLTELSYKEISELLEAFEHGTSLSTTISDELKKQILLKSSTLSDLILQLHSAIKTGAAPPRPWKARSAQKDPRNILDKYKDWQNDLIKKDLKDNSFPYAILMTHLQGDFNLGTVIRSANAFGAREVYYYGKRKFDPRGACGTVHYTDVKYLPSLDDLHKLKDTYVFVGLEQTEKSVYLDGFKWPDKPCMIVLGEESQGLTDEILNLCDHFVEIKQYGSVRSVNAGVAASIAMIDYVNKYGNQKY